MDDMIQFHYKGLEPYNHWEGYDRLRKVEKKSVF